MHTEAVAWNDDGSLSLLDQTRLPDESVYLRLDTVEDVVEAIRMLRVRGAPLIGVAAAMGLAASARRALRNGGLGDDASSVRRWLERAAGAIGSARPTAVNLVWAMDTVTAAASDVLHAGGEDLAGTLVAVLHEAAQRIWDDDAARCIAMADHGARVVPEGTSILTICNTGMLATGGIGTAFGVIRRAYELGRVQHVYACETRPLCQGARLTSWELAKAGIPGTVLVDSAAAMLLSQGRADMVITGADRIAANGDAANKIGTLALANLSRAYRVPFFVAAPLSTVDLRCADGAAIPIEERDGSEIADLAGGVGTYNPAFDVTPADLITGIITEAGVLNPPFEQSITKATDG